MPSLDDVLKVLAFVPVALRRSVALGIVVILGLAGIVDLDQESGPWEAFWNPISLSAAALWSLGLIVVALTKRTTLRMPRTLFWSLTFLAIAVAAAWAAKSRHAYIYNEIGLNQSRSWTKAPKQPEDPSLQLWEWHLSAVKDLTQMPVVVELHQSDRCRFAAFWPSTDSDEYRPIITDQSEGPDGSARWLIKGLHKPAELTFHLRTKDSPIGVPPICRPEISTGTKQ